MSNFQQFWKNEQHLNIDNIFLQPKGFYKKNMKALIVAIS